MTACVEPDCDGTYDSAGYCLTCGFKEPEPARQPPTVPIRADQLPSVHQELEPAVGRTTEPAVGRATGPSRGRATGPSRGRVGAGWVEPPGIAREHPARLTTPEPVIPESQRRCRKCKEPVGRGRDGMPGPVEGVCPECDVPFFFAPTLSKGEMVGDRYEIVRGLARGGQGWIYLARDRHLSDPDAEQWVVLKGLIDTTDEQAVRQAFQERRHLIEVNHPNIVNITDFVLHPDARTGRQAGYIVMEYINGRTLQELYLEHREAGGRRVPLPVTHVLAYGLEVLQALDYLHANELLYCDFKPQNAMYTGEELKLIDLGAVQSARQRAGAVSVYITPGFDAPELHDERVLPSIASDIYTVGRALAVLSLDLAGFTRRFRYQLPDPATTPLLRKYESYHRLLRRATDPDPARRFTSAEQMRGQVEGVLVEILSSAGDRPRNPDGELRAFVSTRFAVERRTFGTDAGAMSGDDDPNASVDWAAVPHALPAPLVDRSDPSAGHLAAIAATDPDDVIAALQGIPIQSREVVLQLVGARIAAGDLAGAAASLDGYAEAAAADWRVDWYRGVAALASGQPAEARVAFDAVYDALPGELPPKLALAAAAEWDGDDGRARTLYEHVWRTDTRFVSAAFGLARVLTRQGEMDDAVTALDGVPEDNRERLTAQIAAVRARLTANLAKSDLEDASARVQALIMDIERETRLAIEVLRKALHWVVNNKDGDRSGKVLDRPLEERELRLALETAYRDLARITDDPGRKIALVKQANSIRPRTLF